MTPEEANQASADLVAKYGLRVSKATLASVLTNQPNVPTLLSRASFRSGAHVRTQQRTQVNRERRNFLSGIIGFATITASALVLLKIVPFSASPQISPPHSNSSNQISNSQSQTATIPSPSTPTGTLLANGMNIPTNQSFTLNDSTYGPILLIHLDNGQFVAYSPICTHAGCQVQFDPSVKDIVCPCHGAVYDPYNNAQVLSGPAPAPLQKIPIQYDASTGNIYLTG